MVGGELRFSWSEPVWPSSGYSSMSPGSASSGHAKGTALVVQGKAVAT
jgi:hypothetical protein